VSTISIPEPGNRPQVSDAAVLTVVASAPTSGSFRPPFCGNDKTSQWNISMLDYSKLFKLSSATITNIPRLQQTSPDEIQEWSLERMFERPWLEHIENYAGDYIHPANSMNDYPQIMAIQSAQAMLALHLDYSDAQKEKLLIRVVQRGIDVYGAMEKGLTYPNNGGHAMGRKMPLIFAGLLLNDAGILKYANAATYFSFGEDQSTFYVSQEDIARVLNKTENRPHTPYRTADLGKPEWGITHASNPSMDSSNWHSAYRDINGTAYVGHALVAHLMNSVSIWNHAAFFDYVDRWWIWESSGRHRIVTSDVYPGTNTGLANNRTYSFCVAIDNGSPREFSITTPSSGIITYSNLLDLLNAATPDVASWMFIAGNNNSGEVWCNTYTEGSSSLATVSRGVSGTDLFSALPAFIKLGQSSDTPSGHRYGGDSNRNSTDRFIRSMWDTYRGNY
jgi:hypothetical protein